MSAFLFALLPLSNVAMAEEVFEFESYKELMIFFQELGYTEESWDAGKREVNRVYLENMPSRWRGKHSKEMEVRMKKEVFFRVYRDPYFGVAFTNTSKGFSNYIGNGERILRIPFG